MIFRAAKVVKLDKAHNDIDDRLEESVEEILCDAPEEEFKAEVDLFLEVENQLEKSQAKKPPTSNILFTDAQLRSGEM